MNSNASEPVNVLIVGVGGQGVIMISKILAELCQSNGFEVKQSEVHGMAKRGGIVFSHVRFGEKVWSPTIPRGEADILVALEWAEGLRWLSYLKPDTGIFIADTQKIVPPFACRQRSHWADQGYASTMPSELMAGLSNGYALDATRIAEEAGNAKASNTVLLGALSTTLEFCEEQWLSLIASSVPAATVDANLKAFAAGRRWPDEARQAVSPEAKSPSPVRMHPTGSVNVTLKIRESWCKGCDICVKICPERCLVLNRDQVVEVTDPDACTGCRLCEWLCPDFAIKVQLEQVLSGNE